MYRQSCHNQKLLKALIFSGHFPKKSWFSNVHFLSCLNPLSIDFMFNVKGMQVEISKVKVCKRARPRGDVCHHMTGRIAQTLQTVRTYTLKLYVKSQSFSISPLLNYPF